MPRKPRSTQFKKGKHAMAWAAMKAMPTFHWQPMAMTEGMKGCGGCHKIGLKTPPEMKDLRRTSAGFGVAPCDSCHTRHTFSKEEAQQPQACETCHMGFDHPQWEMYSLQARRPPRVEKLTFPPSASAPTCQTCHFQNGNHGVQTAWGFLAVRLPMPEDKQWAADRATILQALGVLDPGASRPRWWGQGRRRRAPHPGRLAEAARQDAQDLQSVPLHELCPAATHQGDDMIRDADHLMAEAIRIIAGLYKDGLLPKPANYAYAFPDLLTFHDAPTVIEQKLFVMYLEHRMRTFQGTFHASPDYALWYGWSEMQRDLTEIKEMAAKMRSKHVTAAGQRVINPVARRKAQPQ